MLIEDDEISDYEENVDDNVDDEEDFESSDNDELGDLPIQENGIRIFGPRTWSGIVPKTAQKVPYDVDGKRVFKVTAKTREELHHRCTKCRRATMGERFIYQMAFVRHQS